MSRHRSPKSALERVGQPLDREVAALVVALARAHLLRHVVERVVVGVERDRSSRTRACSPSRQLARLVDLAALEQGLEDAERRRPGADADGRAGLGERLGDREAEPAVVGDAGDERALSRQIDGEHARGIAELLDSRKCADLPRRPAARGIKIAAWHAPAGTASARWRKRSRMRTKARTAPAAAAARSTSCSRRIWRWTSAASLPSPSRWRRSPARSAGAKYEPVLTADGGVTRGEFRGYFEEDDT